MKLLIILLGLLTACTTAYKPGRDVEKKFFAESHRDIKPNDIRKNLAKYKDERVALTGLILSSEIKEVSK